jgi:FlaA1/EpsC-like NDP-sugar epimerase
MAISSEDKGHPPTDWERDPGGERDIAAAFENKRILITGAGGFIGTALARALVKLSVEHLLLLDIAEAGLHELSLQMESNSTTPHALVVGDVCDAGVLRHLFERYRPQVVLHAAACKHVSLMEQNPFAAARTNVLGSQEIARASNEFGAEQLIVISTDKAVDPTGIMGATKRIAELIVLANRGRTKMKAVRLGNVFGSTGSIVPILREQIAQGRPLTITDTACERYFVSIDEAVRWLLLSCLSELSAAVLVTPIGEPRRVIELAHDLVTSLVPDASSLEYRFTGLRPGEKLRERMISEQETAIGSSVAGLLEVVNGDPQPLEVLDAAIEEIAPSVNGWDLGRLLRAIARVVPSYSPSDELLRQVETVSSTRA